MTHTIENNITANVNLEKAKKLPIKIIQFGTGVLLKGLCDYIIDKANQNDNYQGRIIAVKSTPGIAEIDAFNSQNCQYTVYSQGVKDDLELIEKTEVSSIAKVIHAHEDWEELKSYFSSPTVELVLSNTTEIGLNMPELTDIQKDIPNSYPAKLCKLLHHRYATLGHGAATGLIIIPTELVVDNGKILKSVVLHLASHYNDSDFNTWLNQANYFCNSLVDRIVTGKPSTDKYNEIKTEIGYDDPFLICSETYSLWAIEAPETIRHKLSFQNNEYGCVLANDIEQYRELKLRLLNASHSLIAAYGLLAGKIFVKDCLHDFEIAQYLKQTMLQEIAPILSIDQDLCKSYALQVYDRFKNQSIDHKLQGITVQYSSKIKARLIHLVKSYKTKYGTLPVNMMLGLSKYFEFCSQLEIKNEQCGLFINNQWIDYQDINSEIIVAYFKNNEFKTALHALLSDKNIWGENLNNIEGFAETIITNTSESQTTLI